MAEWIPKFGSRALREWLGGHIPNQRHDLVPIQMIASTKRSCARPGAVFQMEALLAQPLYVRAISRATVSGDPTYSDLRSISV